MASGGWLAPTGLLWLCLAPAALLRLHQPQPVLVVEPGKPVEIVCEASKDLISKSAVSWYRRGGRNGPSLVWNCGNTMKERFTCKFGRYSVTLRIDLPHPNDTSLYLCAYRRVQHWHFGSGTVLLVGDSWRAGGWARVLAPHGDPQAPPSPFCAVGATAGPVLLSWPGEPGRLLGLGGSVGPLISRMGTAKGPGGLYQLQFNTSGPPVRWKTELCGATRCSFLTYTTWVLAGAVALLVLSLCLSVRCLLHRPPMDPHSGPPAPPASLEDEGELTYAQLIFTALTRRAP